MFRRFGTNFALLSIFFDGALILASLALAVTIRPILNDRGFFQNIGEAVNLPWLLYPLFTLIWISVFLGASIYDGRKNFRVIEELSSLSWAVLFAGIASAGILYLSFREVSRALFLLFFLFAAISLVGWRMIYRWMLRRFPYRNGKRRVLIVGGGEAGQTVREQIEENPFFGLEFVDFFNSDSLGNGIADLRNVIEQQAVEDVVLALTSKDSQLIGNIALELLDMPVNIWVIPDYYSLALYKARIDEYAGLTMLDLRAPALNDYQRMIKRSLDLVIVILLLPVVLPVMALISGLILIFDPGPIFFNQFRAGENGKPFSMHKFRTMVLGAEKKQKTVDGNHKLREDPRVTSIGKFLRRTSLDELPQIFNVLKGEMSLVGPRPEMLGLVETYQNWQRTRFAVPPGITGWWQVNGRSERPMHLNIEDDLYYINNYSIWLDIQIMFKTIWVVVLGKGAY